MSKATEYEVKTTESEAHPGEFGPAVFRKSTGEKVTPTWNEGTRMSVIDDALHGTVVIILPTWGGDVRFLLDA